MIWNPPLNTLAVTLLVVAVLVVAVASYAWSRRHLDPASPRGMLSLALRGLGFLLLLFFFLQPSSLPAPQHITVKRTLITLIDTSGSMSKRPSADTPSRLDRAREAIKTGRLVEQVDATANLALYGFDGQVTPLKADTLPKAAATGKMTDLAAVLDQAVKLHQGDDVAGILLISDGRNTQGGDPREAVKRLGLPIYAVPIEDPQTATAVKGETKDLAVESVTAEPRVIAGRAAQVAVTIRAVGQGSREVGVEILEGSTVVTTTAVAVSPDRQRRQALLSVKPATLGQHRYTVRVPLEPGDADPANNTSEFTIDVVDPINRLVYLDRLRNERRFLKPMLEAHRNLRYTAVVQQDAKRVMVDGNDAQMKKEAGNLSAAQLAGVKAVILGDLPAAALNNEQIASLKSWVDRGGALLLLAGPSSMGPKGFASTPLADVLPVTVSGDSDGYVESELSVELTPEGAAHPAFQKVKARWASAAPLLSRFGVGSVKPAATVLMASRGKAEPIVVSQNYGHGKVAIVLTDSTWRWQLGFDPAARGGESEHAVFWRQIIDWMLPNLDQETASTSQLQVMTDRTEYEVNDSVVVMASVRGTDGAVIDKASVEFTIDAPDGRPIKRTGKPEGSAFTASFDAAHEGQYGIKAVASVNGSVIGTDEANVPVSQPVIEFTDTRPDPGLLRELANLSGGQLLKPDELPQIAVLAHLEPRELEIQPNAEKDAVSAWDRWWLMALFVGLMSGEWYVRRKSRWV
ncbi:MAG: glutamine amidotransferase [Planctomycetes bacterium]|nr:glutamine amidotransferase [Planctomycetota bacterium]